jgi:hypothetical protein
MRSVLRAEAVMKPGRKVELRTRDSVLGLLTEAEAARLGTPDTVIRLAAGSEYLDLEQLDRGIRRTLAIEAVPGRVLPRKAVQPDTWNRIVEVVGTFRKSLAHQPR